MFYIEMNRIDALAAQPFYRAVEERRLQPIPVTAPPAPAARRPVDWDVGAPGIALEIKLEEAAALAAAYDA